MSEKKRYHRGRRKNKKKKGVVGNIILIVASVVFCVSAFQLFNIYNGYHEGKSEYDTVKKLAIEADPAEAGGDKFLVNFDELLKINPDTVGWLRFYPEPAQINYPLVQGKDNSL